MHTNKKILCGYSVKWKQMKAILEREENEDSEGNLNEDEGP